MGTSDALEMSTTMARDVARRVIEAREKRGWDQSELARRAGVHASYVSRLERAGFKRPSVEKLTAIAAALDRRVTDLTEPPRTVDASEDAEIRRLIEERYGPVSPALMDVLLHKVAGRSKADQQTVIDVVDVILKGLSPRP